MNLGLLTLGPPLLSLHAVSVLFTVVTGPFPSVTGFPGKCCINDGIAVAPVADKRWCYGLISKYPAFTTSFAPFVLVLAPAGGEVG